MALPKGKVSKARGRSRRANWKLELPAIVECKQCHQMKLAHHVCKHCGYYDGKQIVVMDVQTGEIVDGDAIPSSECDMHRIFYKYRTDIDAVIHTHTTYASTYSCFRRPLPAIHYLAAFGGTHVNCAEYATYGTVELARNAFKAMEGVNAVLLANHGLLTGAKTLDQAYNITEELEFCCKMVCTSMAMEASGVKPVVLPQDEMDRMVERFKGYGKVHEKHEEI